jgi:hypothetical protein
VRVNRPAADLSIARGVIMLTLAILLLLGFGIRHFLRGRGVDVGGVLRPAFVVGGIAFAAGFFGPMIFVPGANQGPMLGIFITGPLGFLAGLVYGIVREVARAR